MLHEKMEEILHVKVSKRLRQQGINEMRARILVKARAFDTMGTCERGAHTYIALL